MHDGGLFLPKNQKIMATIENEVVRFVAKQHVCIILVRDFTHISGKIFVDFAGNILQLLEKLLSL